MATPGGAKVPNDLRERIMDRFQAGPGDPRIQIDYVDEANTATTGFFAFGVQTAIQWDQVMRMKLIQILQEARVSQGPDALCNNDDGTPRIVERKNTRPRGQLVYCFQAVDSFDAIQDKKSRSEEALMFMNLSQTTRMHGILLAYIRM